MQGNLAEESLQALRELMRTVLWKKEAIKTLRDFMGSASQFHVLAIRPN
jgi:hypothetical protein